MLILKQWKWIFSLNLSKFILCSKTFELTPVTQLYITKAKADCYMYISHTLIYPYVESSGHNMQRSVVKWALFTFIPRHSQWREKIPTPIDVLIAFSVRHCLQFKVRNQSDPFNRVALFRRQPWRLTKKKKKKMYEWNYNSSFIHCRHLVTCIVPFTCSVKKKKKKKKATFATTYLH